jgi:hypothetical protein
MTQDDTTWPIELTNKSLVNVSYGIFAILVALFGGFLSITLGLLFLSGLTGWKTPLIAVVCTGSILLIVVWLWRRTEISRVGFAQDGIHVSDGGSTKTYCWGDIAGTQVVVANDGRYSRFYKLKLLLQNEENPRYDANVLPLMGKLSVAEMRALVRQGVSRWGSGQFSGSLDEIYPPISPPRRIVGYIIMTIAALMAVTGVLVILFPSAMRHIILSVGH